jgi:glucosamine kinase
MHLIGVDGGGTRSRAVMIDAEGQICGWATAGPGNYQLIGPEGLESLLGELFAKLEIAGKPAPLALCLALAGAGRPEEQQEIMSLITARGWAEVGCATSDARAALEGAHGSDAGLIVIAGTGSIVLGKNLAGEEVRAGGWGPLLGDEGSGYGIGLEALRAVLRARDGWGMHTSLADILQQALGLGQWDDVVRKVYGGEIERQQIAGLGPWVFAAAADGDQVAGEIVDAAGHALGRQVGAVVRRLGLDGEVKLACLGGVFGELERLWPALIAAAGGLRLQRRAPQLPPVLGAVLLAWQRAGRQVDARLIGKLARTAPQMD